MIHTHRYMYVCVCVHFFIYMCIFVHISMHASITRDLKCPFHFEHLKEQSKVALRATTKNLNALTFKRRTAEQVDESMFILAEPTNTHA